MVITRRDFLKYCTASAAALGIGSLELECLAGTLTGPNGPTVLWLQGAGCTGCSVSFLDHISTQAPHNAGEVLIDVVNLAYHPNLMASAGQTAVNGAQAAYEAGGYVLMVEGGIPTAFGGNACWAWTDKGKDVTFEEAVVHLADKAAAIVCVGQCSAYGGIPAAPPNPAGIQSVKAITGKTTINIAGCPPHPDWIVWAVAKLVTGQAINLDSFGRPVDLFPYRIHDQCARKNKQEAHEFGLDGLCMEELGCRGKKSLARAQCPVMKFNNETNWCIGANVPCIGCTDPTFPGTNQFFEDD